MIPSYKYESQDGFPDTFVKQVVGHSSLKPPHPSQRKVLYGSLDSSISAVRRLDGEKAGCKAGQRSPGGAEVGAGNELWKEPSSTGGGPTPLSCNGHRPSWRQAVIQ